ncbi:MAG: response regulator transcription factor [Treponema sp.]|nr:response regulator transcription factor [Treponema sp.]
MSLIRILIASRHDEDQKRILEALPEQTGFLIMGIVRDETSAIIKSECLKPNILILDFKLSEITGLEFVRIIRRKSPSTAIIILFDYIDEKHDLPANLAFFNGIAGILLKDSDIDKLAHIIKIIFLGGCYINSSIVVKIINSTALFCRFNEQTECNIFSTIERSILMLLAQGLSDPQIAEELNISKGTIRNCITEMRQKTKKKSRIEIVIYSLVSGLIHSDHFYIWKKNQLNDIISLGK